MPVTSAVTRSSRRRRHLLTAAAVTGALAVAAAAPAGASAPPTARPSTSPAGFTLPEPTGPDRLGTVSLHLVDTTRTDPWVASHPPRELMVQLWYPAQSARGYAPAPWLSPGAVPHFAETFGLPADVVRATLTHARQGAPVQGRRGGHPVVLYSPGLGGDRGTGTALVEELASHGYVVVTIDHTHDASEVEFPDGRVEVAAIPEIDDAVITQAAEVRVADTRFVLDQLAALDAGRNPTRAGGGSPRACSARSTWTASAWSATPSAAAPRPRRCTTTPVCGPASTSTAPSWARPPPPGPTGRSCS